MKPSDVPINIKESVRTSPPPEVYVDGFIVGNIPAGDGESLVRNDDGDQITTYQNSQGLTAENASNETPKRPDFANGLINFLMAGFQMHCKFVLQAFENKENQYFFLIY